MTDRYEHPVEIIATPAVENYRSQKRGGGSLTTLDNERPTRGDRRALIMLATSTLLLATASLLMLAAAV